MSTLVPFRLLPDFRERVWGSRDLSPIYTEIPGQAPIGEVWLTGDDNHVADGPLAGASLGELCRRYGRDLVGDAAPDPGRFPLLIKFLFPREKLSVQVHPDDASARLLGQPCGKTECWYVLRADPGAQIGLGLKPGATREHFARAIAETRAEELLNWIDVRTGEMIYVDAGTVHTIGGGMVLVETQQNSDATFRLYDYGRPREIHVEQGLKAMKEKTGAGKVKTALAANRGDTARLVSSPCFEVDRYTVQEPLSFTSADGKTTAQVVVAIAGGGVLESAAGAPIAFHRGEAVVVPACAREFRLRPQWELECLCARLPAMTAAPPETVLA